MLPVLGISTYGNLRTNLTWVVSILLAILEFVLLMCLLTPQQRLSVIGSFNQIGLDKVASIAGIALGNQVVAWILVAMLRVHEVMDSGINRWRRTYDATILTALLGPLVERDEVREMIARHPNRAMAGLFYPFVSDFGTGIEKRLVVRFYESIQTYWACRLLQLSLLLGAVEVLALSILDHFQGETWTYLLGWLAVLALLGLTSQIALRHRVLPRVRAATIDEVLAIRTNHQEELETRLSDMLKHIEIARIGGLEIPGDGAWG